MSRSYSSRPMLGRSPLLRNKKEQFHSISLTGAGLLLDFHQIRSPRSASKVYQTQSSTRISQFCAEMGTRYITPPLAPAQSRLEGSGLSMQLMGLNTSSSSLLARCSIQRQTVLAPLFPVSLGCRLRQICHAFRVLDIYGVQMVLTRHLEQTLLLRRRL